MHGHYSVYVKYILDTWLDKEWPSKATEMERMETSNCWSWRGMQIGLLQNLEVLRNELHYVTEMESHAQVLIDHPEVTETKS